MNVNKAEVRPERSLTPLLTENARNDGDRIAVLGQNEAAANGGIDIEIGHQDEKEGKVTWASLPHRRQLIVLTLARLSEPLVQTSLQVCKLNLFISAFADNIGLHVLPAQVIR